LCGEHWAKRKITQDTFFPNEKRLIGENHLITGPLGDQAITIAVETERNMPPLTHIHSHTGIIHTSTQYHANYDKTGGLCFDEIKLSSVETEVSQFRRTAKKRGFMMNQ